MDKRVTKTVLICDNDADHSFTVEGELRNRDFDVIIINDASELVSSTKSLKPVAVLANPDLNGFNDQEVCKSIMNEMNIPLILLVDKNSTHRAQVGNCRADEVIIKPAEVDTLANQINKLMALHKSNP